MEPGPVTEEKNLNRIAHNSRNKGTRGNGFALSGFLHLPRLVSAIEGRNSMKSKIPMIAIGILTAGAMMAQTQPSPAPAAQPPAAEGHHRANTGNRQDRIVQRLTARLNLTVDQQKQVRTFLREAREQNKAFVPKAREERMSLHNALRSDSLGQIDQITQANSEMNSKIMANHVKTMAKIYSVLTPDQKAKFDRRFDRRAGVRQGA